MHLLPVSQINDKKSQEIERDILRTQELNKASDKARKGLAEAEADFKATLARQRLESAQGEEEHAKRVKDMSGEVLALEKRKEQALIPIEIYSRQADEKMTEALECLNTAKVRESEAEELGERLQDKLDEVGQREQDLTKKEQKLILRTASIEHQEAVIQSNAQEISKKWLELSEAKKQQDKEIFDQQESLMLKERSLLAKEEGLKRTERTLDELAIKLKDERETLARAFKRLSPLPAEEEKV